MSDGEASVIYRISPTFRTSKARWPKILSENFEQSTSKMKYRVRHSNIDRLTCTPIESVILSGKETVSSTRSYNHRPILLCWCVRSTNYFTNLATLTHRFHWIYRNVEDIDLVTGALSEAPVPDSVLGPTFLCLLGRTFRNIRLGRCYCSIAA